MIGMPKAYVDKINELIREQTEVSIRVFRKDALGLISMSSGASNYDPDPIITGGRAMTDEKYNWTQPFYCATLERGGFCVGDPNCIFMDNDTERGVDNWNDTIENNVCWATNYHELPDGANEVEIEALFIRGLSDSKIYIEFAGYDYPTKVKLTFDFEREVIVPNDSNKFVFDLHDYQDYFQVVISFYYEHSARARVSYFSKSEYFEFTNNEIINLTHDITSSLLNANLPTNDLSVTLWDVGGNYDPSNRSGYYDDIAQSTCMQVYYGYENMMILRSCLYENGMPRYDNHQLTLVFSDILAFTKDTKNICCYPQATTAGDTLSEKETSITQALSVYNYPEDYGITAFGDTTYTTSAVLIDFAKTDLAQLEAQCIGNILRADRFNPCYFPLSEVISRGVVHKLTDMEFKDGYPTAELKPIPSNIKINKYRYYCENESTELVLKQTVTYNGEHEIYLNGEYNAIAKATLVSATLSVAGTINVTGVGVVPSDTERDGLYISYTVSGMGSTSCEATITLNIYSATGGVSEVVTIKNEVGTDEDMTIDNPLVTNDTVLNNIVDNAKIIYNNRETYTIQVSQDFRIEIGDIVGIDTETEKNIPIVVTELHYALPGRFGSLVGRRITL